jgi:hypothetical protein
MRTAANSAIGAALFIAAPASRYPRMLRIIGVFIVVAGLATALAGVERARAIVEWETARGSMFMRVPAAFALIFGLFRAYATALRREYPSRHLATCRWVNDHRNILIWSAGRPDREVGGPVS